MSIAIYAKDLVKRYGKRTVVNHVSFEVQQGEIVGLLGPNGAGKTTSFYQVVGLVRPDEGHVYLQEEDITALPMYKRAKMGIGYLPQEASVFRKLSVEDNISAVLEMTKLSKAEQKEKLESLLDEFRLHHVRKSNGDVLSGGERRRTEIARALAVSPKFILLDEPFAGIDPIAVEDIQAIVARLKYKNIGILITDHNVTETLSICDRAYLLIDGKIFQQGTAEALAADEQVKKLYLGRNFELKRKDYLHEEAMQASTGLRQTISELIPSKMIYSVESALAMIGKIQDMQLTQQDFADLEAIPGLKDLSNFLPELKAALLQYAGKKDIGDLKSAASTLHLLDLARYTNRKTRIFADDDLNSTQLFDETIIRLMKEDLDQITNDLRSIRLIIEDSASEA